LLDELRREADDDPGSEFDELDNVTPIRRALSPVEHFAAYCRKLRLDNGERFELEPFQEEVAGDIFAGFSETWMIVPEGNGKTTFMAALALYHGDYTESAFVPIGASSREQAEILYRQAEGLVMRTPGCVTASSARRATGGSSACARVAVSRFTRRMTGRRTGSSRRWRCWTSCTAIATFGCTGRGAGSC
jgi:hypothetical protein